MLNARSPSTTPKQQPSRPSSTGQRFSSNTCLPLGSDPHLTWQHTAMACRCTAEPLKVQQQQQQETAATFLGFECSHNGDYRARSLAARRSKSFNSLDACLLQQAPGIAPTPSPGSNTGHYKPPVGFVGGSRPCPPSPSGRSSSRGGRVSGVRASPTSWKGSSAGEYDEQQQLRSCSMDRNGIVAARYAALGSR